MDSGVQCERIRRRGCREGIRLHRYRVTEHKGGGREKEGGGRKRNQEEKDVR